MTAGLLVACTSGSPGPGSTAGVAAASAAPVPEAGGARTGPCGWLRRPRGYPRPDVRESEPILGNLAADFDFSQSPRPPVLVSASPPPGAASTIP